MEKVYRRLESWRRRRHGRSPIPQPLWVAAATVAQHRSSNDHVRLASRFEQLDRIAVGIFQLDLFAARAYFNLIAKMKPSLLQRFNPRRKIGNLEDHPVPAAGLLLATIWHWPGTRSPGVLFQMSLGCLRMFPFPVDS